MLLAAKTNGLTGEDVKPWHVKITFDLPGSRSQTADHGTIEEWWSSDAHYKIAIASTHFEQIEYGSASGILRAGVRNSAPTILASIRRDVLDPIPLKPEQMQYLTIDLRTQTLSEAKLSCLSVTKRMNAEGADAIKPYTYCLDAEQPVLRFRFYPGSGDRQVFSHIVQFRGRFVAKQVEHAFGGLNGQTPGTYWTAQIDVLEALKAADEKDLDPPVGTLRAIKAVTVSEKDSKALIVDRPKPVYPPIAKAMEASGSVVLAVTVGTDGRIWNLHVVSGPPVLQQAAVDAAKKYTFKPYIVDGDAAEMETTITIPFIRNPFDHGAN